MAPKYNLNTDKTLLEFGFNPYYSLTNDVLLGVTIGNQVCENSPLNLFGSVGFVYLLPKNL